MTNVYKVFNTKSEEDFSQFFDKLDLTTNELLTVTSLAENALMSVSEKREKILECLAGSSDGNYEICLKQFKKSNTPRVLKENANLNLNQIMELNNLVDLVSSKLKCENCMQGVFNIIKTKASAQAANMFLGMVQQSQVNNSNLKFNTEIQVNGQNLAEVIYQIKNDIEMFVNGLKSESKEKEEVNESVLMERLFPELDYGKYEWLFYVTANGGRANAYTKWLGNLIVNGNVDPFKNDEYFHDFKDKIDSHKKLKSAGKVKDIMQYSSWKEMVTDVNNQLENHKFNSDFDKKAKEGFNIIAQDGDLILGEVNNREAAIKYGKGTKWCTSSVNNDRYYKRYKCSEYEGLGDNNLFYLIDKNNSENNLGISAYISKSISNLNNIEGISITIFNSEDKNILDIGIDKNRDESEYNYSLSGDEGKDIINVIEKLKNSTINFVIHSIFKYYGINYELNSQNISKKFFDSKITNRDKTLEPVKRLSHAIMRLCNNGVIKMIDSKKYIPLLAKKFGIKQFNEDKILEYIKSILPEKNKYSPYWGYRKEYMKTPIKSLEELFKEYLKTDTSKTITESYDSYKHIIQELDKAKEEVNESVDGYSIEKHLAGVYNIKNGSFRELTSGEQHNLSEQDFKNRLVRYGFQDTEDSKVCYITAWSYADAFNTRRALTKKYPNENVEKWRLEWFQNGDGSWNRPLKKYVEIIGKDGQKLTESYDSYKHIIQELDKAKEEVNESFEEERARKWVRQERNPKLLKTEIGYIEKLIRSCNDTEEANRLHSLLSAAKSKLAALTKTSQPQLEECAIQDVVSSVCGENTFADLFNDIAKPMIVNITVNNEGCCEEEPCEEPCEVAIQSTEVTVQKEPSISLLTNSQTGSIVPVSGIRGSLTENLDEEINEEKTLPSGDYTVVAYDIVVDEYFEGEYNLHDKKVLKIHHNANTSLDEEIKEAILEDMGESYNDSIKVVDYEYQIVDRVADDQLDEDTVYDHSWYEVEGQKYPKRTKNGVECKNNKKLDEAWHAEIEVYDICYDLMSGTSYETEYQEEPTPEELESDIYDRIQDIEGVRPSDFTYEIARKWSDEEDEEEETSAPDDTDDEDFWDGEETTVQETASCGASCASNVSGFAKPLGTKTKKKVKESSLGLNMFKENIQNDIESGYEINGNNVQYKIFEDKGYLFINNAILKANEKNTILEAIDDLYNECLEIPTLEGYNYIQLNILMEEENNMNNQDSLVLDPEEEQKKKEREQNLNNQLSMNANAKISFNDEQQASTVDDQQFVGIDDTDPSDKKYVIKDPISGKIRIAKSDQISVQESFLNETKPARYHQHLGKNKSFANISASRSDDELEKPGNEKDKQKQSESNNKKTEQLKKDIKDLGLSYIKTYGAWRDEGPVTQENSFLIPNISKEQALELGKKYGQYSVIFKEKGEDTAYMYITLDNEDFGKPDMEFDMSGDSKFKQVKQDKDELEPYSGYTGLKPNGKGYNLSYQPK